MKKIINLVLSFFLTIMIFAFSLTLVAGTITSEGFFNIILNISGFTEKAEQEIADELKDTAIPSGLGEDFFNDKIKTDYIKTFAKSAIEEGLKKESSYSPDIEGLKNEIYNDILSYAEQNGVVVSEESKEMLKETASLSAEPYVNLAHRPFFMVAEIIKGFSKILYIAALVVFAILLMLVLLLKGKKELSFGLLGGGIMLVLPIFLCISGAAFKFSISSLALLSYINFFIGTAIGILCFLGFLFIALGIITAKLNKNN